MFSRRISLAAALVLAALTAPPMIAANALQARSFEASGPIAVSPNQSASACATNLTSNQVKVLIAFLNANTAPNPNNVPANQILAAREAALDPGHGFCVPVTGSGLNNAAKPLPNSLVPWDDNIIAVVVQGGIFTGTTGTADPYVVQPGVILQPNGASAVVVQGGIVASLQILSGGNTFLTPSMAVRIVNPGPPGNK